MTRIPVLSIPGNSASIADLDPATRLRALAADRAWSRRFFAGDPAARAEYDELQAAVIGPVSLEQPRTAADMRRAAELMHDDAIPAEVAAAIAEQERVEREARS